MAILSAVKRWTPGLLGLSVSLPLGFAYAPIVGIFFGVSAAALLYGGLSVVSAARGHGHSKRVVRPVQGALINVLRSRDVSVSHIDPAIVGRTAPLDKAGHIWLPPDWAGQDADRERVQDMLSQRLGTTVRCSWDMSGARPSVSLSVPRTPPTSVPWDMALSHADVDRPYLGESAAGHVYWDREDDSPHAGVLAGSGAGKSEIIAWKTAQIMRGGAGVVVLDPKGTSHRWLLNREDVLYVTERAMLHDTVIWLDDELERRKRRNLASARDLDFPQIVVLIEERNSLQDMLRDHWYEIKESGQRAKSPGLVAMDRLNSMGRSLGFTVILAGQESASQHIGSRSNFGVFLMGGRMAANHYRNVGISRKPAMSGSPGRMAYVVAGTATPFQAAYVDAKGEPDRLWEWATAGKPLYNVKLAMDGATGARWPAAEPLHNAPTEEVMTSDDSAASPSSEPMSSEIVTLAEYAESHPESPLGRLKNARDRRATSGFPEPVKTVGRTQLYLQAELDAWAA
jgi:hypothetical protein